MGKDVHRRGGRKASHTNFIGIDRRAADSPAFIELSVFARALYLDLRRQFNGYNNGDICAADTILESYGWSHSTIAKHLKQIVDHGLMVKTRQGGIGAMSKYPTLYAFTDRETMPIPAKGIKAAMASHAYCEYQSTPKPKRVRKKR